MADLDRFRDQMASLRQGWDAVAACVAEIGFAAVELDLEASQGHWRGNLLPVAPSGA